MAYTAPSTVSTLQTYTSAAHNIIVNDIIDHESRISTVQNAQYALKNLLINGAMQFSQRGTSVTGISSAAAGSYYTADRWSTFNNGTPTGTWTQAVSADAPTGSGFRNSLRMTCATALTSLSATSLLFVRQELEGQTLQMIRKGTSSAQQLTLSFWAKSNKTGTYVSELFDRDNTRQVSASYTINSADTWEQKTITFPADTTGVFDNDNASSMFLAFWLVAGTDFTSGSLNTTWNANTSANRAVGQTNLAGVVGQYIAITGVQLEVGSVASPYEFLQYDEELRRCQRYYIRWGGNSTYELIPANGIGISTTVAQFCITHPVAMRSASRTVDYNALRIVDGTVGIGNAVPTYSATETGLYTTDVTMTVASGAVQYRPYIMSTNNTTAGYLGLSAEL